MKLKLFWHRQITALLPIMFAVYIPTLFVLYILVVVKLQTQLPISYFTRDPSAIMKAPFFIGILSNIGIVIWCSSAAICLFSYAVLRKTINQKKLPSFFLFSGLVTSTLALDDLFLFHESVFPNYFHIPQEVVYAVYVTIMLLYFIKFRLIILKAELIFLVLASIFLIVSILGDNLISGSQKYLFVEDAAKFLGIVSWFTYFTRVCIKEIRCAILSQQANVN